MSDEQFKVQFSTLLDADEAMAVRQLARLNDRSIGAEIRVAIRAHLALSRENVEHSARVAVEKAESA